MADELDMEKILDDAATTPASGSVDGQSFTARSVDDLIKLDRYLSAKKAAKNGKIGIRIIKTEGSSTND